MHDKVSTLGAALAYDPAAPLRPEIEKTDDELNLSVSRIRYTGIRRQRVTGLLVEPAGDGPFPALVFLHPFSSDKMFFLSEARYLAEEGFISLLIEAPQKRPEPHRLTVDIRNPKSLPAVYMQTIGDIKRGYDILEQLDTVATECFGYVGQDEGGSLASAVSALEPRAKSIIAIAAVPRQSVYWNESEDPAARARRQELGGLELRQYTRALEEFDATTMIKYARAENWLFQFASSDERTSKKELDLLRAELKEDAEIRFYDDTGMESIVPVTDRMHWLQSKLAPR